MDSSTPDSEDGIDMLQLVGTQRAGKQSRKRSAFDRDPTLSDPESETPEDSQRDLDGELEVSPGSDALSTQSSSLSASWTPVTSQSSTSSSGTPRRPKSGRATQRFRHKKISIFRSGNKEQSSEAESILSELKKTNTSINALAQKMKKTEKRMQRVEKRVKVSSSPPSSADDKCALKRTSIPAGIRVSRKHSYT